MSVKAKTVFFLERLNRRAAKGKREGIYRVCGLIRSASKSTLKIRSGHAGPGAVPHAHTRGGLRLIEFAVSGNTGIIGPILFRGKRESVPHTLEFGGLVRRKKGLIHYPRHPFMSVTLNRLRRRGDIPRQFSATLGKQL